MIEETGPVTTPGSFDVAVVGGGPAGAAVAIALARSGVSVILLERTDGTGNPVGESLPPSAAPLLHRIGAWDAVAATRPVAIHANCSVWGSPEPDERDFLREPYGPGWRVDRSAFNAALLAEAERAGAVVLRHARVRGAERDGSCWRLAIAPAHPAGEPGARSGASPFVIPSLSRDLVFESRSRGVETSSAARQCPASGTDEIPRQARDDEVVRAEGVARAAGVAERAPGVPIPAHDIRARFVVDATGRSALIARALGARRVPFERLAGAVAVLPAVGTAARLPEAMEWADEELRNGQSRRPPGDESPGYGNEAPPGLNTARARSNSAAMANPAVSLRAVPEIETGSHPACSAPEGLRSRSPGLKPRAGGTDDRVQPSSSRDPATLVEATPDGWWYSGLLPNGGLVAAFFSAPSILAATHARHPDGWYALVRETGPTSERIAAFGPLPDAPFVAAAGMARLHRAAGDGWLAVGDAAACHDPLTSHGIGHALHHGPLAAATILAHLNGDAAALPDWAARVTADHERCRILLRAVYALEDRWPDAPFWRSRVTR